MRAGRRIGLLGIALLAAVSLLGGCGGGSNSAARKLHAVILSGCGNSGSIENELRGLVAGVKATEREFEDAADPEENKSQVLRAMKENIAAIHRELLPFNDCIRNVLREREGKAPLGPVHAPPRPAGGTVTVRRTGPAEIEPGGPPTSSLPCSYVDTDGKAQIEIFGDGGGCVKMRPSSQLSFSYYRGAGPAPIRVAIGGYEMWLKPGQKGVIPGPVGNYLANGSHGAQVAGTAGAGTLIVEPEPSGR
jgi:hypothetical protein